MKKRAFAFTFAFSALTGLSALTVPNTAFASGKPGFCSDAFFGEEIEIGNTELESLRKKDFSAYWSKVIEVLKTAPHESSLGADKIESWVVAHFFFDRMDLATSSDREYSTLVELWDTQSDTSPFLPFRKTFEKSLALSKSRVQLSFDMIADIHRSMMDGKPKIEDAKKGEISWFDLIKERALFQWKNVEGIETQDIGRIRSISVGFVLARGPNRLGLPKYKNPLLTAVERQTETGKQAWALYASLTSIDRFIDQLSPNVRKQVEAARVSKTLNDENKELTKLVIDDLLKSAIQTHTLQIAAAQTLEQRVEAHAKFVWKFISIHPFMNGNGRTGRALLTRLLMSEGLTPPLLKNQNDVVISENAYAEQVKEGIALASRFLDDIAWRAQNGWEPSKTPVALLARLPKRIYFETQQEDIGQRYADVDVYDFAQFIRMDASKANIKGETAVLRDYVAHLKRWTAYRAKTGEEYQVRFVPNEMQEAALKVDSVDRARWKLKKSLFYTSDFAWRGLAATAEYSLDQLLSLFVKPEGILLSMHSANAQGAAAIATSVFQDYEAFNKKVLSPKDFFKMSSDHMKAEGDYYKSPLLSAAMTRAVADRFSKGFLTGKDAILKQKGQLVVAAYAPKFGTSYFNRLGPISKRLDLGFMSMYPRQQEIAIAGVIAPDSVMRVEYRDVKVLNVAENTGENIAGDTEIKSVTTLERDLAEPSMIKVTVSTEEGVVQSKRTFKIVVKESGVDFKEIK